MSKWPLEMTSHQYVKAHLWGWFVCVRCTKVREDAWKGKVTQETQEYGFGCKYCDEVESGIRMPWAHDLGLVKITDEDCNPPQPSSDLVRWVKEWGITLARREP